jgi:hypothetical protein
MWQTISPYLAALLPTVGILVIAYVVFKTIFEADRRERRAVAQWEAAHPRAEAVPGAERLGEPGSGETLTPRARENTRGGLEEDNGEDRT